MKSRQKGWRGSMEKKLDISKVYDKLEWCFLETMMRMLGFNEVWISRMMTCVITVSKAVLVNVQPNLLLPQLEV